MIRPSEIETSTHFWDTELQNTESEIVARNITVLSQALAFARDDDRWQAFTLGEYTEFREATGITPVSSVELSIVRDLTNRGYLTCDCTDNYAITNKFLGVVVKFASPESVAQVIAK